MTLHECRDRARMIGSYLDGELEAAKMIELDEHIAGCDTCREEAHLLRAMRGSLKRVVRTSAPVGLRERMATAMAAEKVREDVRADADAEALGAKAPVVSLSSWRTMVPLATAAALALMWGAATRGSNPIGAANETRAGFGDDLLSDFMAEVTHPLPPEAKDAESVRNLERYVGVPLQPNSFERAGAHLVGARILPLHAQRGAMLQYVVGTGADERRVSVLVYDAEKIQIGDANLVPRPIGTAEVRVGREKGYSVAAAQRAGVGYIVAGDLDPDRSAQLAAMVYDDR
ncbi:MAG TPA: zf-HC2 domain-containing protein [Polyangiaceae bacterium]|nr:zf-HC2 domain-containing protein [Polyangiaceae bacterium]